MITDKIFDEERALYNIADETVVRCTFDGPADGESALKECRRFTATACGFRLRYPLWHCHDFTIDDCRLSESCRAALWYDTNGTIQNSELNGIKALRECQRITVKGCKSCSEELGWKCKELTLIDSEFNSQYFLLMSQGVTMRNCKMRGKYSFQYITDSIIENCELDTKDAFWHAKNVTVKNCFVKGEYLAWYAENITFDHCVIEGTQPLCYCKGLRLIDCKMNGCDLSFEYSDVQANIIGHIDSVKNPLGGTITADSIGEIIFGDAVMDCKGVVIDKSKA